MNTLQVFSYNGAQIRTVEQNGEPWWVLKDVCDILGTANSRDVVNRLDDDEKVGRSNRHPWRSAGNDDN